VDYIFADFVTDSWSRFSCRARTDTHT